MTDDQVPGLRLGGAVVTALFAVPWAWTGASGLDPGPAGQVRRAAVALVVVAVLCALVAGRGDVRALPAGWSRRVNLIGVAQAVVIGVLVILLLRTGNDAWLPPAVCMVVGLHFLPLAQVLAQPQYWWTGVMLCGVALAGSLTLLDVPAGISQAVVGCGAATVLWVTSVHLAGRG